MAAAATGLRQAAATAASTSVKPIFSRDLNEAKRRVRELYRAWYREVPNTGERQGCIQGPGGTYPRSLGRAEVTYWDRKEPWASGEGGHPSQSAPHRDRASERPSRFGGLCSLFLMEPLGGASAGPS